MRARLYYSQSHNNWIIVWKVEQFILIVIFWKLFWIALAQGSSILREFSITRGVRKNLELKKLHSHSYDYLYLLITLLTGNHRHYLRYYALISSHPGGVIPGNPRAFAQLHLHILPTQKQDLFIKSYKSPSPRGKQEGALPSQNVHYWKTFLLAIIIFYLL